MVYAQSFTITEKLAWEKQAKSIEIVKDNWGVPHIYTNTDADAVFGMMYVQCEEYFSKVEDVIISRMGRESEVQGKSAIYKDLWSRLYIDTLKAQQLYLKCSPKQKNYVMPMLQVSITIYLRTQTISLNYYKEYNLGFPF